MMFAIITPALITGAFAERKRFKLTVNAAGADGLFAGNSGLLLSQILAVIVTAAYASLATW